MKLLLAPFVLAISMACIVSSLGAQFVNINAGLMGVSNGSADWGDFDVDGDMDILLTGWNVNSVRYAEIYQNNGNGNFTSINAGLTGVRYSSAAWGDYDNDGDLDIIVSGESSSTSSTSTCITKIYKNNGNGSFSDIGAGLVGVRYSSLAWGDYDNDGDVDVLLSGRNGGLTSTYSYTSCIYRNDGNDVFSYQNVGFMSLGYSSVAWADYNNDGAIDVIITGKPTTGNRQTRLYRNNGNGSFTEVNAGFSGVSNSSIAWGDYDNDGYLDLLYAGAFSDIGCGTYLHRNNGDGTFTLVQAGLTGVRSSSVAWCDYDNDGDLDIALSGEYTATGGYDTTILYRNDGGNIFTNVVSGLPVVDSPNIAWGDYDNNGALDILIVGSGTARIYANSAAVFFNTPPSPPTNMSITSNSDFVTFGWMEASDFQTPSAGLNYKLRIGTMPTNNDVVSSMSLDSGYQLTPAIGFTNINRSKYITATKFTSSNKFYCSAQAIDGAFSGSEFSDIKVFSIINVLAPNGNETVASNSTLTAYWSAHNWVGSVNVLLSINNGNSWITLTPNPIMASLGRYSFTVPNIESSQCLIKVVSSTNEHWLDVSDNCFSIMLMPSQTLTIVSPLNQKLQVGKTYNIAWLALGVNNVKIEYSTDAGISWSIIDDSTPSIDGGYLWLVPNTPASICYLKISDVSNANTYDMSDDPFSIVALAVLTPNGDELLLAGSSHTITWTSSFISNLKIEYSIDNGSSWSQIVASTSASSGLYNWVVPIQTSDQCFIRVIDVSDGGISDFSDSNFTIASLLISYPNSSGIKLQTGRSVEITWDQSFIPGSVSIELTRDGGLSYSLIASNIPADSGSFIWLISENASNNCKIRFKSDINSNVYDVSDYSFTICSMNLVSPNGLELWAYESSHSIIWNSSEVTTIKIEYSINDGIDWIVIVPSILASIGTYNWAVPNTPSTLCRVRISDAANASISDVSELCFSIRPQIIITAPNGNEFVSINSLYSITWTVTSDVSSVAIHYSINNGTSWLPVQSSAYPASLGSFDWIVPNNPSSSCLIKISNYDSPSQFDTSDGTFCIILYPGPPNADFSSDLTEGLEPLLVQFYDDSTPTTGTIIERMWDFGDGSSSTLTNPTHLYVSEGVYTVSLTVSDVYGVYSTVTKENYIMVLQDSPKIELLSNPIVNFGDVYIGDTSAPQTIEIKNTGAHPLIVSSVSYNNIPAQFELNNPVLPIEIQPMGTAQLSLVFIPVTNSAVNDSIHIHSNASNLPILSLKLTGTGQYVPPAAVEGVEVNIVVNDAVISWLPVTETIYGTPIQPDRYIVLYNETPYEDENFYYYLVSSTGLIATHYEVALFRQAMFYKVVAVKFYRDSEAGILTALRSSDKKINWGELKTLLRGIKN